MGRRGGMAVLLAAMAFTAGCGGGGRASDARTEGERTTSTLSSGGTPTTSSTDAPAANPPRKGGAGKRGSPSGSASEGGSSTSTTPTTASLKGGSPDYPLTLSGPACAAQGSVLSVSVITAPDADLAIVVAFSDGNSHETTKLAQADPTGKYTVDIAVTPKMPTGKATLMVAAGSGGEGRTDGHEFTVVRPGGECS